MGPPQPKVPLDWKEARRLYVEDRRSYAEIAREFGYAPRTVRHALTERGIPRRRPSPARTRKWSQDSIAIDLGGTIEDSWQSKRSWFASRGFQVGPWPRSRNAVIRTIGARTALYELMAAEVYSHENILRREPVEGVVSAMKVLATRFRIIVVSSRHEAHRATTREWLDRNHLSAFIGDIALLGTYADKLSWCRDAGVDVLIDDDIRHLESGGAAHFPMAIHFSARPPEPHRPRQGLTVAGSWKDVVTLLMAPHGAPASGDDGVRAGQ